MSSLTSPLTARRGLEARIAAVDDLGAEVALEPVVELVAVADRMASLARAAAERLDALDSAAVAATLEARNAALAAEAARRADAELRAEQAEAAAEGAWASVRQGLERAVDARRRSSMESQEVLQEFREAAAAAAERATRAEENASAAEAVAARSDRSY